jgi:hypothetical protein
MPRKKKPLYRPRNILIALALLFAFATAREVYLAMTAVPGASVDFHARVAALIESGQPADAPVDSPNAVDLLDKAIVLEAEVQADIRATAQMANGQYPIDYTLLRGPMSTKAYGKAVFNQIKTNSLKAIEDLKKTQFREVLDQVAAARRAVRPTPASGHLVGFLLPNLGRYRNLARLNGARMYLAHHEGDEAELVRTYEQTLALGRVAGHGTFLIEYLVGIAIDALAMNEIREGIIEKPLSERALLELLAAMDRQTLPPMKTVIEGEHLSTLDTIQWTHTDDGRGSGRLITSKVSQLTGMWGGSAGAGWMSQMGGWRLANLGGGVFPSKASNVRRADEFFGLISDAVDKPHYRRSDAAKRIDDLVEKLPARYIVLRMILPAWGKSLQSWDHHAAAWEGTRAMLAIEIYRHRRGRYPATIDEIVPNVLPSMPIDPFSGKPFGYRILEPGSDSRGRQYLLYSTGVDQKDNGGNMAKFNHQAFQPRAGIGFDFVINEPRTLPEPDEPEPAPAVETPVETSPAQPATTGATGSASP